VEAAEPDIVLFGNRSVEEPSSILRQELRIILWVAIYPAVFVCLLVLVFEVPRVDAHPDIREPGVTLCLLFCEATAVVDDVVGLPCTGDGRDLLDKRLKNCSKCLDIC
jgi:hypothetical protein